MKIRQPNSFTKKANKLVKNDEHLKRKLKETFDILSLNPFDPSLFTHKLRGDLEGKFSCRLTYDLRIVFEITEEEGEDKIILFTIGSHDEVY